MYRKVLYAVILVLLSIYSFALIDPNLTFINHRLWESFRDKMVYFGYYQRQYSWIAYVALIAGLFAFHYLLTKRITKKDDRPFRIALMISAILLFSYPFLSHDSFSYLFDARILTFYHKNPYLYKPGDFYLDPWLRFTQWTDRAYPYGPVFLLVSAIPSFLGMGKFLLSFLFMKGVFFVFYLLAVHTLQQKDARWAMIFATHPLVIIEGLVNAHNDLIAVSLAIMGIYYLSKHRYFLSRVLLLSSAGIKYITLPLVFLSQKNKRINYLVSVALISILGYLSLKSEIQPWYFLALFALFPYFENAIGRLNFFFAGLLFSYYPYIRYGGWGKIIGWTSEQKVTLKHQIIFAFFLINMGCWLIKGPIARLIRRRYTS